MCLAHYFLPNATSFSPFRQMSNSEYRAPPNDRARYDMQKELLGTNVTVKLLQNESCRCYVMRLSLGA